MSDLCRLIWCALIGPFRSRVALEAEILVVQQQLNVLRCKSSKRLALSNVDRLLFAGLYRGAPGVLDALKILKPENQNVVVEYRSIEDHPLRGWNRALPLLPMPR